MAKRVRSSEEVAAIEAAPFISSDFSAKSFPARRLPCATSGACLEDFLAMHQEELSLAIGPWTDDNSGS